MTIAITGATGHLGRLVVESLLAREVSADETVATGRDVSKISDLAAQGVRTQASDYNDLDRCARSSPTRTGSSWCPAVRLDNACRSTAT